MVAPGHALVIRGCIGLPPLSPETVVEVLAELGRLGVGFAQGFFIATPLPTKDFPYLR